MQNAPPAATANIHIDNSVRDEEGTAHVKVLFGLYVIRWLFLRINRFGWTNDIHMYRCLSAAIAVGYEHGTQQNL